jgi:DNA-binding IscR family transcriptional regulator
VSCVSGKGKVLCRLNSRCPFKEVWRRARDAVEKVYDSTTLRDLIDIEQTAAERTAPLEYVV